MSKQEMTARLDKIQTELFELLTEAAELFKQGGDKPESCWLEPSQENALADLLM